MASLVGRFYHRGTYYECLRSIDAGPFVVSERRFPGGYLEPLHDHSAPYLMKVLSGGLTEGDVDYGSSDIGYQPRGKHVSQVHSQGSHLVVIEGTDCLGAEATRFEDPLLHFRLMEIVAEMRCNDLFSALSIESIATLVWSYLCNRTPSCSESAPKWLRRVAERLADDADTSWTLSALSEEAGVHPATVVRVFKKHFGCSPAEFARNERLARAKVLLSSSDLEVGMIAMKTGFADHSHFGRWFRKKYGVSPLAYRECTD